MGPDVITPTIVNFTLDDNQPRLFTHQPDPTTSKLSYNQLVYSQKNLTIKQHMLVISTSGIRVPAYTNFDYAIYTCVPMINVLSDFCVKCRLIIILLDMKISLRRQPGATATKALQSRLL